MARAPKLPGFEQKIPPVIANKSEELYEVQTNRIDLQGREAQLRGELVDLCVEHKIDALDLDELDPPLELRRKPQADKISVKKKKQPADAASDEDTAGADAH